MARNYPLKPIEPITVQYVKILQKREIAVFGLTARERDKWYDTPMPSIDALTIYQLKSIGIELNKNSFNDLEWIKDPQYFEGVFFADLELKGDYLLKLFTGVSKFPEKVIFIDDKLLQVESVAAVLNSLGMDYTCYWYVATDEKALRFDPLVANIQLYYFLVTGGKEVVSDEQAVSIATQHPEKTAEYYLHAVIEYVSFISSFSWKNISP